MEIVFHLGLGNMNNSCTLRGDRGPKGNDMGIRNIVRPTWDIFL